MKFSYVLITLLLFIIGGALPEASAIDTNKTFNLLKRRPNTLLSWKSVKFENKNSGKIDHVFSLNHPYAQTIKYWAGGDKVVSQNLRQKMLPFESIQSFSGIDANSEAILKLKTADNYDTRYLPITVYRKDGGRENYIVRLRHEAKRYSISNRLASQYQKPGQLLTSRGTLYKQSGQQVAQSVAVRDESYIIGDATSTDYTIETPTVQTQTIDESLNSIETDEIDFQDEINIAETTVAETGGIDYDLSTEIESFDFVTQDAGLQILSMREPVTITQRVDEVKTVQQDLEMTEVEEIVEEIEMVDIVEPRSLYIADSFDRCRVGIGGGATMDYAEYKYKPGLDFDYTSFGLPSGNAYADCRIYKRIFLDAEAKFLRARIQDDFGMLKGAYAWNYWMDSYDLGIGYRFSSHHLGHRTQHALKLTGSLSYWPILRALIPPTSQQRDLFAFDKSEFVSIGLGYKLSRMSESRKWRIFGDLSYYLPIELLDMGPNASAVFLIDAQLGFTRKISALDVGLSFHVNGHMGSYEDEFFNNYPFDKFDIKGTLLLNLEYAF